MKENADSAELMTRYLLGELSEEEQLRMEQEFFTNEDSYEQLQAIEDELRYDYARGNLNRRQKELFEKRFLATPADRERVTLAKAVLDKSFEAAALRNIAPARKSSVWQAFGAFFRQPSFAPIAALLAVACGTGLLMEEIRLRGRMDQMASVQRTEQQSSQSAADALRHELSQERTRREELEQQASRPKPAPSTFLSFVLAPGLTRGDEGPKRLLIPQGIDSVRLQLDLKNRQPQSTYRAALQTLDGEELWSQEIPGGTAGAATLTLPARLFNSGDYVIELKNGTARPDDFYFTVVRR